VSVSPSVVWGGLELNPLSAAQSGFLAVVESVDGWFDTPDYDGRNAALVLSDGAMRGPKTAGPRDITVTGVASGPRPDLAAFRDALVMRAASGMPAALSIPDPAGRLMTAMVRADTDGLKHTFRGPDAFRYQLTVTAVDPRLYGEAQAAHLSNLGGTDTGWRYSAQSAHNTWSTVVSAAPWPDAHPWVMQVLQCLPTGAPITISRSGFTIYTTPATPPATVTSNIPVGAIPAGVLGFIAYLGDSGANPVEIVDPRGNKWTEIPPAINGNTAMRGFVSNITTALAAGDVVGVKATPPPTGFFGCLYPITGMAYKATTTATGNSTTPTVTATPIDSPSVILLAVPGAGQPPAVGYVTDPGWNHFGGDSGNANNMTNTVSWKAFSAPALWRPTGLMQMSVGAAAAYPLAQSETVAVAAGDVVTMTATVFAGPSAQKFLLQLVSGDLASFVSSPVTAAGAGAWVTLTLPWVIPAGVAQVMGRVLMAGPAGDGNVPAGASCMVSLAQITRGGVLLNATPTFGSGVAPWTFAGAAGSWAQGTVRLYPRRYASPMVPNSATLGNAGNVPAPATALYTGPLSQSRLEDSATGRVINVAELEDGMSIIVDTSTLGAWAEGGATRASYILAGSQPLLVPAAASAVWTLYATGAGSVDLAWRPAWH
jgi:hypothetical protein